MYVPSDYYTYPKQEILSFLIESTLANKLV